MHSLSQLACLAILLAVSPSAHAGRFAKADFKYSSDSHLPPADRFAHARGTIEDAADVVRGFISDREGQVTVSTTGEAASFKLAPQARERWDAQRKIFEAEWSSYRDNDFKAYKKIDRTDPLASQPAIEFVTTPLSASFYFRAETVPRVEHRDLNFSWFKVRVDERILSALYAWGWQDDTGKTVVYARAAPKLGKVEAAPGAWVDYDLWDAIAGVYERDMVSELLAALGS